MKPLLLFSVLYIVFAKFLHLGSSVPHYPVYLLLGLVMWTYFVEATATGLGSIVGRGDLLRKVSLPKYIIVLSTSFTALVNLLLNLVVVGIFIAVSHTPLHLSALYLPIFLIELMVLAAGVSFLLSALFVKYRDISYIWEVVLQVMFYATPIIYAVSVIPVRFQKIVMLNPLAQIIQSARYDVVTKAAVKSSQVLPTVGWWLPPLITVIIAALGGLYFRSQSKSFAEDI
jgi:ABC-2 type transport system permease protein